MAQLKIGKIGGTEAEEMQEQIIRTLTQAPGYRETAKGMAVFGEDWRERATNLALRRVGFAG